ncbi:MAG: hypothetical protein II518_03840, partial [Candidatus Methanomethylophilus sp.]|nr:hypothetical protein [Methanomethylophilus sp.]
KAMRSLGQFRGECSIKSWLCTIARNLWLSDVRKNKRKLRTKCLSSTMMIFRLK